MCMNGAWPVHSNELEQDNPECYSEFLIACWMWHIGLLWFGR